MSDIPNVISLAGVGEFCSDGLSFNVPFSLIQYLAKTVIIAKINPELKKYDNNWKLKGFLNDDKKPIECEHLLLFSKTISIPRGIEQDWKFMPLNADIIIGNKLDKPIKEAYYPLLSYFEGAFSLTDDRWNIEVIKNPNSAEQTKSIAENWQIPIEGLTLHLSHPGATLEQYREKARQIAILLSLACGNEVTFHRQIISWDIDNEIEIWRRMKGGEYGPGVCVPIISKYLKETLPIWRTFSEKEQKEIQLAFTYINLSAKGYMDEKLLRISQAWEMLANVWGNQTKEVKDSAKDPIKELIAEMNDAYRKWKVKYPDKDEDGFLKSRINDALNWDKVLKKINRLANSYKINTQIIGLNFQQLIKARNDVAHDCKMSEAIRNNANSSPYKLLMAAQFGLRILLLKKLGYSGKIVTSKYERRTDEEISEYIVK